MPGLDLGSECSLKAFAELLLALTPFVLSLRYLVLDFGYTITVLLVVLTYPSVLFGEIVLSRLPRRCALLLFLAARLLAPLPPRLLAL